MTHDEALAEIIDMAKKYAVPVPVTKKIDEAIRQRLETVQKEKTR